MSHGGDASDTRFGAPGTPQRGRRGPRRSRSFTELSEAATPDVGGGSGKGKRLQRSKSGQVGPLRGHEVRELTDNYDDDGLDQAGPAGEAGAPQPPQHAHALLEVPAEEGEGAPTTPTALGRLHDVASRLDEAGAHVTRSRRKLKKSKSGVLGGGGGARERLRGGGSAGDMRQLRSGGGSASDMRQVRRTPRRSKSEHDLRRGGAAGLDKPLLVDSEELCTHTLPKHVVCLAAHADTHMWLGMKEGGVHVVDTASGRVLRRIGLDGEVVRTMLAVHETMWLGLACGDLVVMDAASMEHVRWCKRAHKGSLHCLALAGDRTVYSGGADWIVRSWDAERAEPQHEYQGHTNAVRSMAVHEHFLFTGSDDRTLRVWDWTQHECLYELEGHSGSVLACVAVGDKIWTGCEDGVVRIFDARTVKFECQLPGHSQRVARLAVVGDHVWSASTDHSIIVWHATRCERLRTLTAHTSFVSDIAAVGAWQVWTCSNDKTVRVWLGEGLVERAHGSQAAVRADAGTAATAEAVEELRSDNRQMLQMLEAAQGKLQAMEEQTDALHDQVATLQDEATEVIRLEHELATFVPNFVQDAVELGLETDDEVYGHVLSELLDIMSAQFVTQRHDLVRLVVEQQTSMQQARSESVDMVHEVVQRTRGKTAEDTLHALRDHFGDHLFEQHEYWVEPLVRELAAQAAAAPAASMRTAADVVRAVTEEVAASGSVAAREDVLQRVCTRVPDVDADADGLAALVDAQLASLDSMRVHAERMDAELELLRAATEELCVMERVEDKWDTDALCSELKQRGDWSDAFVHEHETTVALLVDLRQRARDVDMAWVRATDDAWHHDAANKDDAERSLEAMLGASYVQTRLRDASAPEVEQEHEQPEEQRDEVAEQELEQRDEVAEQEQQQRDEVAEQEQQQRDEVAEQEQEQPDEVAEQEQQESDAEQQQQQQRDDEQQQQQSDDEQQQQQSDDEQPLHAGGAAADDTDASASESGSDLSNDTAAEGERVLHMEIMRVVLEMLDMLSSVEELRAEDVLTEVSADIGESAAAHHEDAIRELVRVVRHAGSTAVRGGVERDVDAQMETLLQREADVVNEMERMARLAKGAVSPGDLVSELTHEFTPAFVAARRDMLTRIATLCVSQARLEAERVPGAAVAELAQRTMSEARRGSLARDALLEAQLRPLTPKTERTPHGYVLDDDAVANADAEEQVDRIVEMISRVRALCRETEDEPEIAQVLEVLEDEFGLEFVSDRLDLIDLLTLEATEDRKRAGEQLEREADLIMCVGGMLADDPNVAMRELVDDLAITFGDAFVNARRELIGHVRSELEDAHARGAATVQVPRGEGADEGATSPRSPQSPGSAPATPPSSGPRSPANVPLALHSRPGKQATPSTPVVASAVAMTAMLVQLQVVFTESVNAADQLRALLQHESAADTSALVTVDEMRASATGAIELIRRAAVSAETVDRLSEEVAALRREVAQLRPAGDQLDAVWAKYNDMAQELAEEVQRHRTAEDDLDRARMLIESLSTQLQHARAQSSVFEQAASAAESEVADILQELGDYVHTMKDGEAEAQLRKRRKSAVPDSVITMLNSRIAVLAEQVDDLRKENTALRGRRESTLSLTSEQSLPAGVTPRDFEELETEVELLRTENMRLKQQSRSHAPSDASDGAAIVAALQVPPPELERLESELMAKESELAILRAHADELEERFAIEEDQALSGAEVEALRESARELREELSRKDRYISILEQDSVDLKRRHDKAVTDVGVEAERHNAAEEELRSAHALIADLAEMLEAVDDDGDGDDDAGVREGDESGESSGDDEEGGVDLDALRERVVRFHEQVRSTARRREKRARKSVVAQSGHMDMHIRLSEVKTTLFKRQETIEKLQEEVALLSARSVDDSDVSPRYRASPVGVGTNSPRVSVLPSLESIRSGADTEESSPTSEVLGVGDTSITPRGENSGAPVPMTSRESESPEDAVPLTARTRISGFLGKDLASGEGEDDDAEGGAGSAAARIKQLEERVGELEWDLEMMTADKEDLEEQLGQLEEKKNKVEEEAAGDDDKVVEEEKEAAGEERENKAAPAAERSREELEVLLAKREEELHALHMEMVVAVAEVQEQVAERDEELAELRAQTLTGSIAGDSVLGMEDAVNVGELMAKVARMEEELQHARSGRNVSQLHEQNDRLRAENEALKAAGASSAPTESRVVDELESTISQLETEMSQLRDTPEHDVNMNAELEQMRIELVEEQARHAEAESELEKAHGMLRAANEQLQAHADVIRQLESEVDEAESDLEVVLGQLSQYMDKRDSAAEKARVRARRESSVSVRRESDVHGVGTMEHQAQLATLAHQVQQLQAENDRLRRASTSGGALAAVAEEESESNAVGEVPLVEEPEASGEATQATAEETEASGEETGATEATPEETGVTPEETEVTPEETEATPEETEATPEETEATPEATEATPEVTEVTPEETEATPEETGVTAEEMEVTPEETKATGHGVSEKTEAMLEDLRAENERLRAEIDSLKAAKATDPVFPTELADREHEAMREEVESVDGSYSARSTPRKPTVEEPFTPRSGVMVANSSDKVVFAHVEQIAHDLRTSLDAAEAESVDTVGLHRVRELYASLEVEVYKMVRLLRQRATWDRSMQPRMQSLHHQLASIKTSLTIALYS